VRRALALCATATMVVWTDAIPAPSFQNVGRESRSGLAPAGLLHPLAPSAGAIAPIEAFPFRPEEGLQVAPIPSELVALDPDPDRFGSGRPTPLPDTEVADAFAPAGGERGELSVGEGAFWDLLFSDPLLRDLFGPGPLAGFLEEMLRGVRGEGQPIALAALLHEILHESSKPAARRWQPAFGWGAGNRPPSWSPLSWSSAGGALGTVRLQEFRFSDAPGEATRGGAPVPPHEARPTHEAGPADPPPLRPPPDSGPWPGEAPGRSDPGAMEPRTPAPMQIAEPSSLALVTFALFGLFALARLPRG